jgi:hypothetical protein
MAGLPRVGLSSLIFSHYYLTGSAACILLGRTTNVQQTQLYPASTALIKTSLLSSPPGQAGQTRAKQEQNQETHSLVR